MYITLYDYHNVMNNSQNVVIMSEVIKKILIVDDDEATRAIIAQMLKKDSYIIDHAESGEAALEKIIRNSYDLLILDYMMPDVDGLDVLSKVKELDPNVRVIMITAAHLSTDIALDAIKKGASHYLTKPFELKKFRRIVKRALTDVTPDQFGIGLDN